VSRRATTLEAEVERLAADPDAASAAVAEQVIAELLASLEQGTVRAAERDTDGQWRAVPWVKRGILLAFRVGTVVGMSPDPGHGTHVFSFVDKHTLPPRILAVEDRVRIVPGGSTIRRGAHVAAGVVCMPPMYINAGAWIGAGTMVDSHALVGSCAQIGERVHLSAAAQIGGVLEPVNATPVVIEDDVVVGGNCGVYEGTIVRRRAVLAAGVVLTRSTPVYDLPQRRVIRAGGGGTLEIPEGAVVVPGSRAVHDEWGAAQGLALQTPVIVKYRDEKTDASTALEQWLR
jgi:2,3,4,5-tetrahydropyridine-2-carboxylate N-succinyltransferase